MDITSVIGRIPYRMAFAGGWIDQPFASRLNPDPPGSVVVVSIEPEVRFMDRCGMATGTRKVAMELWNGRIPAGNPEALVRELYRAENGNRPEPSGSQDMVGLIYPGVSRIDYDAGFEGGCFPVHVESNCDAGVARWIERVVRMVPVCQRPEGYNPLGVKNLDPQWIARLGRSGRDCFDAIAAQDVLRLGAAMNECMTCWATILPHTVRHPTIALDLPALLSYYQSRYPGAMYSGCGGGYMYVVSEEPVPGSFGITVRTS